LTTIEILALIFAIAVITKVIMRLLCSKKCLNNWISSFTKIKGYNWISLVIAVALFYFVIQTITIIEFLAVWMVIAFFMHSVMFSYKKDTFAFMKSAVKNMNYCWLQMVFIIILAIWALKELFF